MEDLKIAHWELGVSKEPSLAEMLKAMYQAKYVHAEYDGMNIILIFNQNLYHKDMAERKLRGMTVKSAGFIMTFDDVDEVTVYGESMSLDIKCDKALNPYIQNWLRTNYK